MPYIVPITIGILAALFFVQPHGSGRVGVAFGPVLLVWFASLAALGIYGIAGNPGVLSALSPHHAVAFFAAHGWRGFGVLGAVILCVTGGEALYADMGHFGVRPIRAMWYTLVLARHPLPSGRLSEREPGANRLDEALGGRDTRAMLDSLKRFFQAV